MYSKYLKYLCKHKFYVFLECYKLKIPFLGLIHDWSKFRLSEFIPYAQHFYAQGSNIQKGRDETGYYQAGNTESDQFNMAWLLHQKRNKHHWQWWLLPMDDSSTKVFEMPLKYRKEMLTDWRGAGRAQGAPDTKAWYEKNKYKMQLGIFTRKWIEVWLNN